MKTKTPPRFDIDALRNLAGGTSLARGEEYYRDGQVVILSIEPTRVLAQVAGTEDYRTMLTGRGKTIGGECSRPAFDDWGFCKHMVATALAANAAGTDAGTNGIGALEGIRRHLKEQGVDALVAMIVDMAERDPALFRRLDLAAATVQGDDKTLEARLRKAIDGATRTRGFVDYRGAAAWAEGEDAALDAVAGLASGRLAGLALKLVERTIERVEQAVEDIDDSDGHCSTLLQRARDIHLAAARAARPDPVALARDLFAREMEDDCGTFGGAVALYADALGDAGLAEYRRLAAEAWAKLPPRIGETRAHDESLGDYDRLKDILDVFAEREGDVQARIALRAKDLSSPWSYLQLAEFCRTQGRDDEALRRAEEGLWLFDAGRPDEPLLLFTVGLLAKAGRKSDAEAHLRRAFEKMPSLTLYARLRKLGGRAARERAVAFLEARLAKETRTQWHSLVDLLVQILIREKRFAPAWAAVRGHRASMGVREVLARATEGTHPREALDTYAERVEQLANAGGDSAYAEAAKLIARMTALRSAPEQAAYVAGLKTRFGRKRNLMKLLA
jgi:uncharacterized Zn finger protein